MATRRADPRAAGVCGGYLQHVLVVVKAIASTRRDGSYGSYRVSCVPDGAAALPILDTGRPTSRLPTP